MQRAFSPPPAQVFLLGYNGKKGDYLCLLSSPTNSWPPSLSPLLTEAMWPMAPYADGADGYSTGSVPGQQGQPDDLSNVRQLPQLKARNSIKYLKGLGTLKCGFSQLHRDF